MGEERATQTTISEYYETNIDSLLSSGELPWRNEKVLFSLYHNHGLTQEEIADKLGCSRSTVTQWMAKHQITLRPNCGESIAAHSSKPVPHRFRPPSGKTNLEYEEWRSYIDGRQHSILVHRLLAVSEYGLDAIDGMIVHHKNQVPFDNRPDNIELLTPEEHATKHQACD